MQKIINMLRGAAGIKIGHRMALVFSMGCILPLILVYIYMFQSSNKALVAQEIKSGQESLEVQREILTSKLNQVTELSERFYYDEESNGVTIKTYSVDNGILAKPGNYELFDAYVSEYYWDIQNINFYMEAEKIKADEVHFKHLTAALKEKDWYKKTMQFEGTPRWSYYSNIQTGQRSLRLTRALFNGEGEVVGAISIELDPALTENYIKSQSAHAILVLNDTDIVRGNVSATEKDIASIVKEMRSADFSGQVTFHGEHCETSEVKITPLYSPDTYTIILMLPYGGMNRQAVKKTIKSLIPLMLAAVIMAVSGIILNRWISYRITALGQAMHHVVERSAEAADGAIGEAHDEIWELYNDLNKMVVDMRDLSDTAANERIQREQLYSRKKDVEFKMLSNQINPHFLYNTLETIRMLAIINKQKEIEDISVTLTRLLRSSLEAGRDLKTLAWEMDKVECYVKIQNYRFGDRINAVVEYDKERAEDCMVLPFVVQPFVENAYVHAMEDKESDGRITIRAEIRKELYLVVEDNGHGMSKEQIADVTRYLNDFENLDRSHIGICNVNQRIKLRFGDSYGVTFTSVENEGTRVEIHLPFIKRYGTWQEITPKK